MACCADGLIGWSDPGTVPIREDREIRLAMSDYSRAESQTVSSDCGAAPDSPTGRGRGQAVDVVRGNKSFGSTGVNESFKCSRSEKKWRTFHWKLPAIPRSFLSENSYEKQAFLRKHKYTQVNNVTP